MGTAKWWVCDSCMSLNDIPADKCYKCRESKPANPRLFDDQYSEVGGSERVGVTVDLDKVGDLTSPDPTETAHGGAIMEAFEKVDDPYADLDQARQAGADPPGTPAYDPHAGGSGGPQQRSGPRPLREPAKRGIDALGGLTASFEPEPPGAGYEGTDAAVQPPPSEGQPPGAPPPSPPAAPRPPPPPPKPPEGE